MKKKTQAKHRFWKAQMLETTILKKNNMLKKKHVGKNNLKNIFWKKKHIFEKPILETQFL